MVEDIGIKYTKRDNNWFCNTCHGEIYSSKKPYISLCLCIPRTHQIKIYSTYLKNYYHIDGSQYICKICSLNIKSKREYHGLNCKGFGTRSTPVNLLDPSRFSTTCDMGCGNESKFFYKSGKAYCCKQGNNCPVKVAEDSSKKLGFNPFYNKPHPRGMLGKAPHNKGKTKETSESIMRQTLAQIKTRKEKGHNWVGKKMSDESKKKMSDLMKKRYASGWEPVCGRAPKYSHSSPIAGNITVDGSWELAFAQILDKVNIKWERNKKRFDYEHLEGGISTYQPDFFVHSWGKFIEVKGYQTDLDICKWRQFNEPLFVIKRNHINKIKQWLKDCNEVNEQMLYDLIKDSTKEDILK